MRRVGTLLVALALIGACSHCPDTKQPATIASAASVGRSPHGIARCDQIVRARQVGEEPQGPFLEGVGFERLNFPALPQTPSYPLELQAQSVCSSTNAAKFKAQLISCSGAQDGPICVVRISGLADPQDDPSGTACGISLAKGPVDVGATLFQGYWNEAGEWIKDSTRMTLSCNASQNPGQNGHLDGAVAKCSNPRTNDGGFGYSPSSTSEEMFRACIRAARADYCGDGHSATELGTLIDLYDHDGHFDAGCKAGYCLEASWYSGGAVCIAHMRWDNGGGNHVAKCDDVNGVKVKFKKDPPLTGCPLHCREVTPLPNPVLFDRSDHHAKTLITPAEPCRPDEIDPDCPAGAHCTNWR